MLGFMGVIVRQSGQPDKVASLELPDQLGDPRTDVLIALARKLVQQGGGEVLRPMADVSPEDNAILGPLCASVVEFVSRGEAGHVGAIVVGQAVRTVSGADFFWIRGTIDGGTSTTVERIDASTAAEAAAKFRASPQMLVSEALRMLTQLEAQSDPD